LTFELKPYQDVSEAFLVANPHAMLFDEPRVGKTPPSIRACDKLRVKSVAVVCPAHLVENWIVEVERWRRGGWYVVVFGFNRGEDILPRLRFHGMHFDVLIIDESQYAKNEKADRTKALYGPNMDGIDGILSFADRAWWLSGTPQPNHSGELWPMLHAGFPHLIMRSNGRPMPRSVFEAKYCTRINNGFGWKIVGSKNAKELKAKMAPVMLRRTRKEALGRDLQDWTTVFVTTPVNLRKELKSFEDSAEGQKMLRALQRGGLKELAKEASSATLRRMIGLAKAPGIVDLVKDELDGDMVKIVIGCHHREVMDALRKGLLKYKPLMIRGGIDNKLQIKDQFQTIAAHRVMLVQNGAGGTGLDFSAADDFLSAEPSWVGDDNDQVSARIFNTQKDRPCFRRYAVLAGSIDEEIVAAATRKTKDAKKLLS
jgi:SWI/SNF-related matrix-associated actin-dependent regulator of chromatin subfamily A-like protein 1